LQTLRLNGDREYLDEFHQEWDLRAVVEDELGILHDVTDSAETSWAYSHGSFTNSVTLISKGRFRIVDWDSIPSSFEIYVWCHFRGQTQFSKILVNRAPVDIDGDGLPDSWEILYGLNPSDASDGLEDPDGDSLHNLQEYTIGTNPVRADTDGDGLDDLIDDAPLVPERQKPSITLISPSPQTTVEAQGHLFVSVEATDNVRVARAEAQVDGAWHPLARGASKEWSGQIIVPNRLDHLILRVRAYDPAGNNAQVVQIIEVLDTIAPVVTWESPLPGTVLTAGQTVQASAHATDAVGIRRLAIYDDDSGEVIAESQTGSLQAPIVVPSVAVWRLRVAAEDTAGNIGILTRVFTVRTDVDPPVIRAVQPNDGTILPANTPFTVRVEAEDAGSGLATLVVLVGTISTGAQPFSDGSAMVTAPAVAGPFVVSVRVTDRAGNVASAIRSVEASDAERDPPELVINAPVAGSTWLHHQDIPVVVDVTDASALAGVVIAVDGVPVRTLITAPYVTTVRAPGLGLTALLAVEVSDIHGNVTSQDREVFLAADTVAPQIRLDPPDGSRFAPGQSVAIHVDATDDAGVDKIVLRINGELVPLDADGRAGWHMPADPGEVVTDMVATDRSGNTAFLTGHWTVDSSIALWLDGPTAGQALYAGADLPLELGFTADVRAHTRVVVVNGQPQQNAPGIPGSGTRRFLGLLTPSVDRVQVLVSAQTIDGRDLMAQRSFVVLPWPRPLQVAGLVQDSQGSPMTGMAIWSPGLEMTLSAADGSFALSIPRAIPESPRLELGARTSIPKLINCHGLWRGIADDGRGRPGPVGVRIPGYPYPEPAYAHHLWHSGCVLTSLSEQWRYWARVAQVLGVERSRTLESVGVGPAEVGTP